MPFPFSRHVAATPARWLAVLITVLLGATLVAVAPAAADPAGLPDAPRIEVLSNRADLISGGDALVEVVLPSRVDPSNVRVDVDGRDVTAAFAVRDNGRFYGVVEGLTIGRNLLTADVRPSVQSRAPAGKSSAQLQITNHPIGGPVVSGPQIQPWVCTTEAAGLGLAVDDQCNAERSIVEFFYRRTSGGGFVAYDPVDPPADVATVTTDQGVTVPYIVRRERGTMNRGIYDVAVLFDPTQPWEPWAPQEAWNGKLIWQFGPGAGTQHRQGATQSVLQDARLSAGFMVANHSLNTHGSNANTIVNAESVMMVKEHIVETYGKIR
jgi:hypothetical protein